MNREGRVKVEREIEGVGKVIADAAFSVMDDGTTYLGETQILYLPPLFAINVSPDRKGLLRRPFTLTDGQLLRIALEVELGKQLAGD